MIICEFQKDGHKAQLRHVVVHALVEQDGKILLEKRASHLLEGGKWALPGGYMDRDETGDQAALRELKEETGWTGKVVGLLRVNTNPDRRNDQNIQNIALDFIINPIEKIGVGDKEVDGLEWFALDQLPEENMMAFDHRESIELYKKYREGKLTIPLWK